jgi:hypothetical protein
MAAAEACKGASVLTEHHTSKTPATAVGTSSCCCFDEREQLKQSNYVLESHSTTILHTVSQQLMGINPCFGINRYTRIPGK